MVEQGVNGLLRQIQMVAAAVAVGLLGWVGVTVSNNNETIAITRAEVQTVSKALDRLLDNINQRTGGEVQYIELKSDVKDHELRIRELERSSRRSQERPIPRADSHE
jgi:hypothetical protein